MTEDVLPSNVILVNEVQKGNPLLQHLRCVPWRFTSSISADYVMSTTCALFVTVKYHHRHPKVIIWE